MSQPIQTNNRLITTPPSPRNGTSPFYVDKPGLQPQGSKFTLTNPVFGSGQNVINQLSFFFPVAAFNAIDFSVVKAGFGANQLIRGGYNPDEPDCLDYSIAHGGKMFTNTPVYGSIEFGNTDLNNKQGNNYTGIDDKAYTFENMIFPICLVTCNQPHNIIKTKITGRNGSIKESIGLDDWQITINCVVDMPADQAPVTFLSQLWQMKKAAASIPVTNYYLNLFDINYIVIDDIELAQQEGGYAMQAFTITATSDIPLDELLP